LIKTHEIIDVIIPTEAEFESCWRQQKKQMAIDSPSAYFLVRALNILILKKLM